MHLCHLVGNGKESWHRTERHALEVEVESGYYHTDASACKFIADLDDMLVEELCLVNAHHIALLSHEQDACRGIDRRGGNAVALMADNLFLTITDINGRLEYLYLLLGELCTAKAANEFLRLTREHRATHDLHSASAHHLAIA